MTNPDIATKKVIRKISASIGGKSEVYQVLDFIHSFTRKDGFDRISRIEDKSLEYEDSIHAIYYVYVEHGKTNEEMQLALIENCPVVVEYYV